MNPCLAMATTLLLVSTVGACNVSEDESVTDATATGDVQDDDIPDAEADADTDTVGETDDDPSDDPSDEIGGPVCCEVAEYLTCGCVGLGGSPDENGRCEVFCDSDPAEWVFYEDRNGCTVLDTGPGSCLDCDRYPDACPDPQGLAEAQAHVDGASRASYEASTMEGPTPPATCIGEPPLAGGDECGVDAECGESDVCRPWALSPQSWTCGCFPTECATDDDCGEGMACLQGSQGYGGSCDGTRLCANTCVPATCRGQGDCGDNETCVVQRGSL